jgi:membrane protein YdbS with pleckstrin-like domain
MRCSNCGSFLDSDSRFCKNCGTATPDPEETRLARPEISTPVRHAVDDDEIEHVIFTVRPTLLFVKIGYGLAMLGAILFTILLQFIPLLRDIPVYITIPFALALLLIPGYYHLKRNMIRYTLTDSKIEIDYGLIARTTRNVPLSKIQDVTVSTSIRQRILGFGDVVIDNASDVGGSTVMHNIHNPRHYADLLLRAQRRWH